MEAEIFGDERDYEIGGIYYNGPMYVIDEDDHDSNYDDCDDCDGSSENG